MSILDINIGSTLIILGDEYKVDIKTPADMDEYQYRRYEDWDMFNDYASLGKMVMAIKEEISNIPMEKFKTYTRYAQVKKILRKYMRTSTYNEKWELSSKPMWGTKPFDWSHMTIRLSSKPYLDCLFSKNIIPLIEVNIFKINHHGHPF